MLAPSRHTDCPDGSSSWNSGRSTHDPCAPHRSAIAARSASFASPTAIVRIDRESGPDAEYRAIHRGRLQCAGSGYGAELHIKCPNNLSMITVRQRQRDDMRSMTGDPPIRFRRNAPTSWIEMTLTEGRNRQVRRMTAACGNPTLRLVRVAIGAWSLGELRPGEWKICE